MKLRESSLDDLIRAQREAGGMTAAQRAQNRTRLLTRAVVGAVVSSASVSGASTLAASARASAAGSWIVKAALGIGLASAVGTVYWVTRPATVRSAADGVQLASKRALAPQPVATGALPAPATSDLRSAEPVPSAALASASEKPRAARRAPESPSLAVEVQLMHDVDSALRAGRSELALTLLDERRGGDGGVMGEERSVARIVTLCQLGRVDAARAEATRFLRDRPRSPLAARVRATCGKPVESSGSRKPQ
jgi:hypothetical protein